jgi:nitrate reductase cytochrome c-type subunit
VLKINYQLLKVVSYKKKEKHMKKIALLMAIAFMGTGVMAQTVNPTPAKASKTAKTVKAKAPKAPKATKSSKTAKATPAATTAPAAAPVQVNVSQNQSNKK